MTARRFGAIAAILAGVLSASGASAQVQQQPADTTTREVRVVRGTRVHIGGGVDVRDNEIIEGPVVAIGGSANVDGEVREDVVAVGGNVKLGPHARVGGDVTSVGGVIERDPQAEVGGQTNEVTINFHGVHLGPLVMVPGSWWLGNWFGPAFAFTATAFRMLLFGILAAIALLVAARPLSLIQETVTAEPWKAGLVGLLVEMFFVPALIVAILVLTVSIVGIPLLLVVPPLAIAALVVLFIAGFAGVASIVGRLLRARTGSASASPFPTLLLGLLAIWALTIAGRLVAFIGWPLWFFSGALIAAGFFVEYVAWTVGLGAALIVAFENRKKKQTVATA